MITAALEFHAPPDEPVITFRRFFAAPRELVFKVWTEPDHLRNWWGPRVLELVVCEIDLRVGGSFRSVLRTPDGQEFASRGTYREIERPLRIVSTFALESAPQDEAVESITFAEVDGGTGLTGRTVHRSIEARDRLAANGMMEAGLSDQYLRLDGYLCTLALG